MFGKKITKPEITSRVHSNRSLKHILVIGWLALLILPGFFVAGGLPSVQANGGTVIFADDSGAFNIYLVLSPSPPTPDVPAHFSLLLNTKDRGIPVGTATILVEPSMPGMEMPGVTGQRLSQFQGRPNQYEGDIALSMEGQWQFKITVVDPQLGSTSFTTGAKVEKPAVTWPIIAAILVAMPVMAILTWWFLFRSQDDEEEEDGDDKEDGDRDEPRGEGKGIANEAGA